MQGRKGMEGLCTCTWWWSNLKGYIQWYNVTPSHRLFGDAFPFFWQDGFSSPSEAWAQQNAPATSPAAVLYPQASNSCTWHGGTSCILRWTDLGDFLVTHHLIAVRSISLSLMFYSLLYSHALVMACAQAWLVSSTSALPAAAVPAAALRSPTPPPVAHGNGRVRRVSVGTASVPRLQLGLGGLPPPPGISLSLKPDLPQLKQLGQPFPPVSPRVLRFPNWSHKVKW